MNRLHACLTGCLVLTLALTGCAGKTAEEKETSASLESSYESSEIRAVWFSWPDYRDLLQNLKETDFTAEVQNITSNLKTAGFNTVYVQATAFTDAFYDSSIYPRSSVLPDIDYDPLKIFVTCAEEQGLRIEAWINPMRSVLETEVESLPEDFIVRQWIERNDERVRLVSGRYYLNPAYEDVRALIVSTVQEILDHYDVDGIHMDDYFYPDGTEKKFDAYVYSLAVKENSELTREDFRRSNTASLIQEIHDAVKNKSSSLVFGVSPAGNYDLDVNTYFADPAQWVKQGTVDYLAPQIYWGFDHPTKPFEATLDEWLDIVKDTDTDLIVGLAAYKCGAEDPYASTANLEWVENDDILSREIVMSREKGCKGTAMFRYGSLFAPDDSVKENVEKEIINIENVFSSN